MHLRSLAFATVALVAVFAVVAAQNVPPCRFAKLVSAQNLLSQASTQRDFVNAAAYYESAFGAFAVNKESGLTYDGTGIDYSTGEPNSDLHDFSAPSKESLHLMVLAKALAGNEAASIFVTRKMDFTATEVRDKVLSALELKLKAFEQWNVDYPGFGGYIPWFNVKNGVARPMDAWKDSVPALDMSEMIWGLYACEIASWQISSTSARAKAVSMRLNKYLALLAKTAPIMFYDGNGNIRGVATIKDVQAPPTNPDNYGMNCDVKVTNCYLDDPYEGEMMAVFMYLYSTNLTDSDRQNIWINKRPKLKAVTYDSSYGPITVQEGFWFSSHEQWKYLELPYLTASPTNRRVFMNGERARTHHSREFGIPGLYASVTDVCPAGKTPPTYISAAGIQSIASQKIERRDILTPYGAYPVMLADLGHGLVWYQHMLNFTTMQGPYGSTEAFNANMTMISPVLTWDSKITSFVGMIGGVSDLTEIGLKRDGTYEPFANIIESEWARAFPRLDGEKLPFSLPPKVKAYSANLSDFTTCTVPK